MWKISNLLSSVKTGSKNWCASRTNLWYSSKLSDLLIFITPLIVSIYKKPVSLPFKIFFLSLMVEVILCLKTVLQLTNGLGFSLKQFSSPRYYWQKKIKLMLEQNLKLDQRSESINYHYIMLWSSLVRIKFASYKIIRADKFVARKKYNFYNFHLND